LKNTPGTLPLTKAKLFLKRHWMPVAGFFLSTGLAIFFGVTFLAEAIYFNDPRHRDVALQGWMTPHYLELSYDVPRQVIDEALGLDETDRETRLRLRSIALDRDMTMPEITERVRAAVDAHRQDSQ
jgi:hypothetical protein